MSYYKKSRRDWTPATVQQQTIKPQKVATSSGYKPMRLTNNPVDAEHNHASPQRWVYGGFAPTAPMYHVWRCEGAEPNKPRREVGMVAFNALRFDPDSQAGRGQCSMRKCVGDAVMMSATRHLAYCETCVLRYTVDDRPCPATMTMLCKDIPPLTRGVINRKACVVCEEENAA